MALLLHCRRAVVTLKNILKGVDDGEVMNLTEGFLDFCIGPPDLRGFFVVDAESAKGNNNIV